jgi:hypothetical protein
LKTTTILVSPPGRGLEAVFGPEYTMEGFANPEGIPGVTVGNTLAIRSDSIEAWFLGAAHELLHLLHMNAGPDFHQRIVDVWNQEGFKLGQPDDYPNPHEMFAYLGQWYMAGYGDILKELVPSAYELCRELIGKARIDPEQIGPEDARASLDSLIRWLRSGDHHALGQPEV